MHRHAISVCIGVQMTAGGRNLPTVPVGFEFVSSTLAGVAAGVVESARRFRFSLGVALGVLFLCSVLQPGRCMKNEIGSKWRRCDTVSTRLSSSTVAIRLRPQQWKR